MSIPNTITIYIKTNIYGESFLKLKPSMIDPTNKNNNILFDPLIKLDQNIVDKQGKDTIKSQFLEKPLFNSLITLSFKNCKLLIPLCKELSNFDIWSFTKVFV